MQVSVQGVTWHPAHKTWIVACFFAQPWIRTTSCYSPEDLEEQNFGQDAGRRISVHVLHIHRCPTENKSGFILDQNPGKLLQFLSKF